MSTIEQLLDSDNVRIPASEPERRLIERNVGRRELFVNPTSLEPAARMIMVAGSLMTEHERPVDRVADSVEAQLLCPHQDSDVANVDGDRTLAYSAIRDELYLLVLPQKQERTGRSSGDSLIHGVARADFAG